MNPYHKIQTVFNRDIKTDYKTLIMGEYSLSEFKYLKDNKWVFTEKVDGTNIRVQYGGSVYFKGKSEKAIIPPYLLESLIEIFPEEKLRKAFPDVLEGEASSVCLYGEGYGPKIQKVGKLYRQDHSFVLFDIKVGEWTLQREDVEKIGESLGIDVVPIIGYGTLSEMVEVCERSFNSCWGDFQAEGIVARPEVELKCRNGKRIITKIKHKDFVKESQE